MQVNGASARSNCSGLGTQFYHCRCIEPSGLGHTILQSIKLRAALSRAGSSMSETIAQLV
eukprot:6186517-Pleurochrysis_carterae.AAC.1